MQKLNSVEVGAVVGGGKSCHYEGYFWTNGKNGGTGKCQAKQVCSDKHGSSSTYVDVGPAACVVAK